MKELTIIIKKNDITHEWTVYSNETTFKAFVKDKELRRETTKTDVTKFVDDVIDSINNFVKTLTKDDIRNLLVKKWTKG